MDLPRTNFHLLRDNNLERRFWGKMNIQHAAAYFYYIKGSAYRKLLHDLKYQGQKELGVKLGERMATEIKESGFFNTIDLIIPIPLHKKRYKERGYNQSEQIAKGISKVTGIPIASHCIIRQKHMESQTLKSNFDRIDIMEGVFKLSPSCNCGDKHLLLIDDIITTGATLAACGNVLQEGHPDIKVSVLTIGFVPS